MRRTIGPDTAGVGALDPAAIAEVAAESFPVARDAEELHDALLTLVVVPPVREWEEFFRTLRESRRATVLSAGGANFWVAAERLKSARLLYPDSEIAPAIDDYDRTPTSDQETAATETLRGWLESSGPADAEQPRRGDSRCLPRSWRPRCFGSKPRGRFCAADLPQSAAAHGSEIEWCNRRVLARIHRMTLGRLRREIEPVNARDFMRFLYHWQHLKPGTQLHGPDGALHVIKQLQGYEISAAAWEGDVLRRRIGKYAPELLDQLCISGEVVWGRLSPHPAFDDQERGKNGSARRVRPTRSAPVALFLREDALVAARGGGDIERPATAAKRPISSRGCPGPRVRCSTR